MKTWWERWPGRLEHEIAELCKAGIACELDQEALEKKIAILNIHHHVGGKEQHLRVVFPDFYPYSRFEVFAPELKLEHHQNPFQKNVCMIGRATSNWHTGDTIAAFLISRLPAVIEAGETTDPSKAKELEEHQGEPVSTYYSYFPDSVVLIDSAWSVDSGISGGFLELGVDWSTTSGFRSVVRVVMDRNKETIAEADPELMNMYRHRILGKWVRCQRSILEDAPNHFYEELMRIDKSLLPIWQKLKTRSVAVVGALFPEEVTWRKNRDGWIFVVRDDGNLPRQ